MFIALNYSILFYSCDTLKCLLHWIILFYSILYILWYSRVFNVSLLNSTQTFTQHREICIVPHFYHVASCLPETEGWILSLSPTLSQLMPVFSLFILSRIITIFVSFHLSTLFICPFSLLSTHLYVFSIHQLTNNRDSDSELELGERNVMDTTSFVWNWRYNKSWEKSIREYFSQIGGHGKTTISNRTSKNITGIAHSVIILHKILYNVFNDTRVRK